MDLYLALALTGLALAATTPTGVELERVIDTNSALPGVSEPWVLDGPPPVPCGDGILFRAAEVSASTSWAYHVDSSGVQVVVDEESLLDGSTVGFQAIAELRCALPGRYVFLGVEAPPSTRDASIYEWTVGGQARLLQSGGVPIGGHSFEDFIQLGANSTTAGVLGRLAGPGTTEALAIKPAGQEPTFVADEDVTLPGQSNPVDVLTSPRPQGEDLVFRGLTSGNTGLYRWSKTGGISVLVDNETTVPGGSGTFSSVGRFTVLADGIAFNAEASGGPGIFLLRQSGILEPLVVPGQVTADGETMVSAGSPEGAGSLFSFIGTTVEAGPILSVFMFTPAGEIRRILSVGEMIDGGQVALLAASADDRSVVVRVVADTNDTLEGIIYRVAFGSPAVIPTLSPPGVAVLVLLLLSAALSMLRRARLSLSRSDGARLRL